MKKHLSNGPINIDADHWYYEEPKGIEIYGNHGKIAVISWKKIRKSLEHKDKETP